MQDLEQKYAKTCRIWNKSIRGPSRIWRSDLPATNARWSAPITFVVRGEGTGYCKSGIGQAEGSAPIVQAEAEASSQELRSFRTKVEGLTKELEGLKQESAKSEEERRRLQKLVVDANQTSRKRQEEAAARRASILAYAG